MSQGDVRLLRRSLLGDRNAFGELVRAHQATVMSLVMGWIPRPDDAQEITQEVFTRAYAQLHTLRDPHTFPAWIRAMAFNLSLQQMHRERRTPALEDSVSGMLERDVSPGPEEVVAQKELRAYVDEAFSTLSPDVRQAMTLRWFEGYTYREIAQETGVSEGVVRGRLARGRAQLKEALADLAEEVFRDRRPRESFTRGVVAGLPGLSVWDWLRRMVVLVRLSGLSVWTLVGVVGMVMVLLGGGAYMLWLTPERWEEGSNPLAYTLFHVRLAYIGSERWSEGLRTMGSRGRESLSSGETATVYATEVTWVERASMSTPRSVPAVASVGGKVYVFGGESNDNLGLSSVEAYDPACDTWSLRASMPTGRRGAAAAVVNGKVYVIGGYVHRAFSAVEAYDPATDTWVVKASMPTARCYLATGVVDGKIYAIGGFTPGVCLRTVEAYDPATDIWTARAPMPTRRETLAAGVIESKLYVVGGVKDNGEQGATLEVYDPATDTWAIGPPMSIARSALASVAANGKLYVLGGTIAGDPRSVATVEEYDIGTDAWTMVTPLNVPRNALGATVIGNRIYAVGGYFADSRLATLEEGEVFVAGNPPVADAGEDPTD